MSPRKILEYLSDIDIADNAELAQQVGYLTRAIEELAEVAARGPDAAQAPEEERDELRSLQESAALDLGGGASVARTHAGVRLFVPGNEVATIYLSRSAVEKLGKFAGFEVLEP